VPSDPAGAGHQTGNWRALTQREDPDRVCSPEEPPPSSSLAGGHGDRRREAREHGIRRAARVDFRLSRGAGGAQAHALARRGLQATVSSVRPGTARGRRSHAVVLCAETGSGAVLRASGPIGLARARGRPSAAHGGAAMRRAADDHRGTRTGRARSGGAGTLALPGVGAGERARRGGADRTSRAWAARRRGGTRQKQKGKHAA
jgi:hypothetical protein